IGKKLWLRISTGGTMDGMRGSGTGTDGGTINDAMPERHESVTRSATPWPVLTNHRGNRLPDQPTGVSACFSSEAPGALAVPWTGWGCAVRCFCIRASRSLFLDMVCLVCVPVYGRRSNYRPPECGAGSPVFSTRSEEHTSELQSPCNLVCRLLLEKK